MSRLRVFSFFSLLFVILTLPGAARADGRAELQKLAGQVMASLTGWAGDRGWQAETSGETLVEDSGSYYAVTLPHLSFKDDLGRTLEVGLVALNALPGSRAGDWKVTLAMPSPVVMKGPDGKVLMTVTIGTQAFSGAWSAGRSSFSAISAKYKNIQIDYAPAGIKANLPDVTLTADPGGMMDVAATSARVMFEKTGATLSLARINLRSGGDKASTVKLRALLQKLVPFSPFNDFLYGSSLTVSANGVSLFLPGRTGQTERTMLVDSIRAGVNARNLSGATASLSGDGGFSGLKVTPADPRLAVIIPEQMNFKLDATNLPVDAVIASDPGQKNALLKALSDAGTMVTLRNGALSNPSYAFAADFIQTANAVAPLGATGKGTLTAFGLDTLIGAVTAEATSPSTPPELKPYLRDMMGVFLAMQLTGKPGTDSGGRPVKTYVLENTANGQVLLNGQDMQVLMRMVPKLAK